MKKNQWNRLAISGFLCCILTGCGNMLHHTKPNLADKTINEIWDSIKKDAGDGFSDPISGADFLVEGIFRKKDALNDAEWRSKVFSKELEGYVIKSNLGVDTWNKTLHNAWEMATHYKRLASRSIGRNAMVTYIYEWRDTKNYDGTTRLTTIFLSRNRAGRWFVDDIYTHDAEFSQTSSFSTMLQSKIQ